MQHTLLAQLGAVIGPGGRVIKGIRERTGVDIDCQDDGTVEIVGTDADALELAKQTVLEIAVPPEVGTVVRYVSMKILSISNILCWNIDWGFAVLATVIECMHSPFCSLFAFKGLICITCITGVQLLTRCWHLAALFVLASHAVAWCT